MAGGQHGELSFRARVFFVVSIYAFLLFCGCFGYRLLEGWSWADSLYMTVVTVSTVGFGEVHPLSEAGKLFTVVLIVLGVGSFTYALTSIADYLVKGEIRGIIGKRRLMMELKGLQKHFVVCGYGRVGMRVCKELAADGFDVLVVEADASAAAMAKKHGFLVLEGDANKDEILRQMNVKVAQGLVATLNTDEANIMLVLSARSLSSDLRIVTRCNYEPNEAKLKIAGATKVISPYSIGGRRMAHTITKPNVVDFLDTVMHSDEVEILMEDIQVASGSNLDGSKIAELGIREKTGANIVALKIKNETFRVSPTPDTVLHENDVLLAMGTKDQLAKLKSLNA